MDTIINPGNCPITVLAVIDSHYEEQVTHSLAALHRGGEETAYLDLRNSGIYTECKMLGQISRTSFLSNTSFTALLKNSVIKHEL
eukprot:1139821-Pelagomonas_calceolata.AAC.4